MRLDTVTIVDVCRKAGFYPPRLATVVALADASSGGVTNYRHDYGSPGAGRLRGLWALDIDRHPQYADMALHEPHTAAQVAWELTQAHDGFGWSTVYAAGMHGPYLPHAKIEATRTTVRQPIGDPRTPAAGNPHAEAALTAARALRARIIRRPKPEVPRWPTVTRSSTSRR